VPFQSAYAGGWTEEDVVQTADVQVAELRFGSLVRWEREQAIEVDEDVDPGPNDQKRIVRTLIDASGEAGIPAPRRPWLDDLERTVDMRDLPIHDDRRILLGKADIPERQMQEPMYFVPDRDGSLLVYGTSGAGKSSVLRTVGIGAGMRPENDVEVYGLDFASGALRSLEVLPHVGSIISGDDAERVQRLLRSLGMLLDERGRRFSDANASDISEFREITGERMPRILVLIDNFPQFKAEWDMTSARAPFYAVFMRILGEGRPLGVHAIFTADRSGAVPTGVSSNVSRRVVLRLADENAYVMVGVARDVLDEQSAPGRAIVDGLETQIAVIGATANTAEQNAATVALAAELRACGVSEVVSVGSLPVALDPTSLPDVVDFGPVLGIADDTLAPCSFEPSGTFVIAGPPQSGKTTAMRAVVVALERSGVAASFLHIGGRRAVLRSWRPWARSASTIEDVRSLASDVRDIVADEPVGGRIVVVVENLTDFTDTAAERSLKELLQAVNRSNHFLVADGDVSQLSSSFGLVGEVKASRHGLALRPDTHDGESLFRVPFARIQRHESPPGRGFFVENGRAVTVQVPLVLP